MNSYRASKQYLYLFADCYPTKGVVYFTLSDLRRNKIELFPAAFYEILENSKNLVLSEIYEQYGENYHTEIDKFIEFLINNEYAILIDSIADLPPINKEWDSYGQINNAIIDIKEQKHDFPKIITQLNKLGCSFIQIRIFENIYSLSNIEEILSLMTDTSIEGIELIIKHDPKYTVDDYLSFFESNILISFLYIHSAPESKKVKCQFGYKGNNSDVSNEIARDITFSEVAINSEKKCGIISKKYFCASNVRDFIHNMNYNSCLNKKVSIDASGNIKNCPSLNKSYGNISNTLIGDTIGTSEFQKLWTMSKDKVKICKDCEFRYACTDCRAYIDNPTDEKSKPLKCGYDPYTGKWEEWSKNPLKQKAIKFYELL